MVACPMQDKPDTPYEFIGPDEDGFIRVRIPNLDPKKDRESFCITLGNHKEAIAEAMCEWLSIIDYGECR